MFRKIGMILSLALIIPIGYCGSGSTSDKKDDSSKATVYVNMPANTEIAVALIDSIDTDFQLAGTEFRARLTRPIVVNGKTLFVDGAEAKGILNRVVESGRLKTPAELDFSLTAIQDGNGNWISVGTNMIKDKKGSHTNREVALIGGGAIVGGIIGKIVDKKGSTEIGAAAGAAAGTGLSAATGKKDIFYGAGTEIVFFSSQTMKIAI